jgi:exodeoxyribonuclease-3
VRVTTWNVNGLRAALKKGLHRHLAQLDTDVLLLQEIRATPAQLPAEDQQPDGWFSTWHPAERKGYSGVATWSRRPHWVVGTGMDAPDPEGRILRTRTKRLQLVNVYLPSGSRSAEAQQSKEAWMERFLPWATALADTDEPVILAGDLNIAHTALDIHNPTGNKKNSGFLPHEREWFGQLLASGYTDLLRAQLGEVQGPYSWWSNRGRARELDRGWRIDYLLGNAAAAAACRGASVHRAGGLEVSDHAPVTVDLALR